MDCWVHWLARLVPLALLMMAPAARSARGQSPPPDPTGRYDSREVEGWTVLVNKGFLEEKPELAAEVLALMGQQLYQVQRVVPARALKKLRKVRIWVELREPHHPCMAYHPDPAWLLGHGMNPDKARCVEVANARNFLKWTREQPWMVLHELAHAYHHQFLEKGYDNPDVAAAYRKALKRGLYANVLHYDGDVVKGYAAENPMEFFAEASEAFFGTNDFFPFVRAELKRHDPDTEALIKTLWGAP